MDFRNNFIKGKKMKNVKTYLVLALVVSIIFGSVGCGIYQAPVIPPNALIVTSIKAPLSINYDATPLSTRKGAAESIMVLGLVAFGDCSITTAARNGELKVVNYADYEYFSVLFGIFTRFVVVAYGE